MQEKVVSDNFSSSESDAVFLLDYDVGKVISGKLQSRVVGQEKKKKELDGETILLSIHL